VDVLWTKNRPADLTLCSFETDAYFLDAHLIPGREFVVLLYDNGNIGLNRIERLVVTGEITVREIVKYKETAENRSEIHEKVDDNTSSSKTTASGSSRCHNARSCPSWHAVALPLGSSVRQLPRLKPKSVRNSETLTTQCTYTKRQNRRPARPRNCRPNGE